MLRSLLSSLPPLSKVRLEPFHLSLPHVSSSHTHFVTQLFHLNSAQLRTALFPLAILSDPILVEAARALKSSPQGATVDAKTVVAAARAVAAAGNALQGVESLGEGGRVLAAAASSP